GQESTSKLKTSRNPATVARKHSGHLNWHPCILVNSFKKSLLGSLSGSDSKLSIRHRLGNLMLAYRNTSHATTCQAPTPLMLGHNSRSRLDI
ncbi:hypothetical protein LSAT2_022750, partial [Lamellibrachia satsuma]